MAVAPILQEQVQLLCPECTDSKEEEGNGWCIMQIDQGNPLHKLARTAVSTGGILMGQEEASSTKVAGYREQSDSMMPLF